MLSTGLFVAGLVLFVGGVSSIRVAPSRSDPPKQLFRRQSHRYDAPMEYVQFDGAVLGMVGLLVMLSVTLL